MKTYVSSCMLSAQVALARIGRYFERKDRTRKGIMDIHFMTMCLPGRQRVPQSRTYHIIDSNIRIRQAQTKRRPRQEEMNFASCNHLDVISC